MLETPVDLQLQSLGARFGAPVSEVGDVSNLVY